MGFELIVLLASIVIISGGLLDLRVPAFAAMFSLLVGELLATQVVGESYTFAAALLKLGRVEYVQLVLLLLPLALTVFFLKGRMSKKKLAYEILPALFMSGLLVLFVYPLLPAVKNLVDIATHDQIAHFKDVIYILAAVLGLVSSWLSYPKPFVEGKHGKH